MVFNRFAFFMFFRVTLLTAALAGLSVALTTPGYHAVTLLMSAVVLILLLDLYHFVSRTNLELARFFQTLRHGDYGHQFLTAHAGANFEKLSAAFSDILKNFKASRLQQEENLRHLKSMVEHMPVPLLSLYPDGRIQLHNNATRRLFGSISVNRVEDLRRFGENFFQAIKSIEPGSRRLVNFSYDGAERQLTVVATQVVTGTISEKLISMQDIQSELDDTQLQAWQDLVRVLTHEIMNSITPVASLAKTAADLLDDVRRKLKENADANAVLEDLDDVHHAADTVVRRSDSLLQFVQSYRSLTLLPAPQKQKLVLAELFRRVETLLADHWAARGIALTVKADPESLQLYADPDLLEQLMINLLKNAEQALTGTSNPNVVITGRMNQRGHVLIEVADNGPGIPSDIIHEIFVPFFTTKSQGSGVGLALTRQIMIAHGGSVTAGQSDAGGAKFTLIF
ncbi:MAG TPA: ATP-binding protein [Gammaproteobacteria bacterium]